MSHSPAASPSAGASASTPRRVALFTGASRGHHPQHARAAAELAGYLARAGVGIVYGGGHVGLMGVVADAAMAAGGEVIGVIPQGLFDAEVGHTGVSELEIVPDMHRRKARMAELSDAFVALPGGIGTLEEFFEVWTWQQLGIHDKTVALYNTDGFWDPLLAMIDRLHEDGFVGQDRVQRLVVADDPATLLDLLRAPAAAPAPGAAAGPAPG